METDKNINEEEPLIAPATMLKAFRILGWFEGASMLILLFIAMPMKYMMDIPLATRIVGSIHGALFVAYVAMALQMMTTFKWPLSTLVKSFIGAVLPFGTFVFERKYLKS